MVRLGSSCRKSTSSPTASGEIGKIGGIDTYMSQNVPTFVGTRQQLDAPAAVTGAQSTTYAAVVNTEADSGAQWSLVTGASALATTVIKAGTVFTIGTAATAVHAVNPVTKAVLPFQQMFTVMADVTVTVPVQPR